MREIDDYIAGFPEHIHQRMIRLSETIREAAPEATENISYGMPAFFQKGKLVDYAGYPKRIGFYPGIWQQRSSLFFRSSDVLVKPAGRACQDRKPGQSPGLAMYDIIKKNDGVRN